MMRDTVKPQGVVFLYDLVEELWVVIVDVGEVWARAACVYDHRI